MKKLFTLLTLALLSIGTAWADKIGFTSSKSGSDVAAPVVTTQDHVTVAIARGSQSTGSDKGSMYWGSETALTFKGSCERTQYNSAGITAFNDNVWTGASFAIESGYKFTVTDIQVDIAGQDYEWGYKLDIVNGDGTVTNIQAATTGKPKANSKIQVLKSEQSIVLTGTTYVKLYFYLKGNNSTSKYLAIPELYLTGTVEENVQTKYTKPSIVAGEYSQVNGTYPVTLSVLNSEDGTINYTVGDAAEVTGAASGTVINVAPQTTITAYVTGATFANSDNATFTTSAAPTLATPTYSIAGYDIATNTYSVTLATAAGDITYTVGGGAATAYSAALSLYPGTAVTAYATQTNMTKSATLEFNVPAAPAGGESKSPTTASTYTNNVSYNMGAITIPGGCIAGQISSSTTPINNSIKTRTNQAITGGNGFYVTVNPGYVVTAISIEGCSNQTAANTCNKVYVDGVEVAGFSAVSLPLAAKNGSTGTIAINNINATSKIEFDFENTDQAQMNITVTAEVAKTAALGSLVGENTKAFATFCAARNFTIEGATAYKGKVEAGALSLTALSGVIPANTGVVIAGDASANYTIKYVSTDASADVTGNEIKGTVVRSQTSTLAGSQTLLALNSTAAQFQKFTGENFPATKAYLLVDAGAPLLSLVFNDGETTGVNDVRSKISDVRGDFFDLQGRKVAQPTKGLYIVNGRKVVIK